MKTIIDYINEQFVTESKTADMFLIVADCIKDPKNFNDEDIKRIQKVLKDKYEIEMPKEEVTTLANDIITNFPEMFEK